MWALIVPIGMGVIFLSLWIVEKRRSRLQEEKKYQDIIHELSQIGLFSYCTPTALRAMMEQLNYTVQGTRKYNAFYRDYGYVHFEYLWCMAPHSSQKFLLWGRTLKEHEELLKTFNEICASRERREKEMMQNHNDVSVYFLTTLQKDLNDFIEKEEQVRREKMLAIQSITQDYVKKAEDS